MKQIVLFAILALALSCKDATLTTEDVEGSDTSAIVKDPRDPAPDATTMVEGCYMSVLQRDSFLLQLDQSGKAVTGKLMFDNYQKDGSSGSVKGVIEGDTVKLWYDFQSEGMRSVMEIYLKKDGEDLARGVGEVAIKADTSYFADHGTIEYKTGTVFRKVDCDHVSARLNKTIP